MVEKRKLEEDETAETAVGKEEEASTAELPKEPATKKLAEETKEPPKPSENEPAMAVDESKDSAKKPEEPAAPKPSNPFFSLFRKSGKDDDWDDWDDDGSAKKADASKSKIPTPPKADPSTPPGDVPKPTESTPQNNLFAVDTPQRSFFGGAFAGRDGIHNAGLSENAKIKKGLALNSTASTPGFGSFAAFSNTSGFSFATASAKATSSFNDLLLATPSKSPASKLKKSATTDEDDEEDGDDDAEGKDEETNEGEEKEGEGNEADGFKAKTAVPSAPMETKTGEEDENTVFQLLTLSKARCKLFRMDKDDNSWKERGTGNFRVNLSADNDSARMVMRTSGILKLILNARIYPTMPSSIVQDKFVTFACFEESGSVPTKFLLKTGDEGTAQSILSLLKQYAEPKKAE
ncbi:hypothetical protein HDU96_006183 [Phlyctochytrium bullatum]|nr:hypothetical protein HDU96_006183 [Phlyctochytrium bullatum]